jgi:DNA-binding winged helix-turn-helix (wHTH) protein
VTTSLIPISEPDAQTHRRSLEPSGGRYIRLGPIQVDLQKEEVTKNGSRLKLSGKPYRALVALLERPEQIVTRDTICACLWPSNKSVEYNSNVNTTINKLRRALGDSSETPL